MTAWQTHVITQAVAAAIIFGLPWLFPRTRAILIATFRHPFTHTVIYRNPHPGQYEIGGATGTHLDAGRDEI